MQFPEAAAGNSSAVGEVKLGLMLFLINSAVALVDPSGSSWEKKIAGQNSDIPDLNLTVPSMDNTLANGSAFQAIDLIGSPGTLNSSLDSHDFVNKINDRSANSRIMDSRKFLAFEALQNQLNAEEDGLSRLKIPVFCAAVASFLFGVLLFAKRIVKTERFPPKNNDEENLIINGDDVMYLLSDDKESEKEDLMFSQALFHDCECDCYRHPPVCNALVH